MPESHGRLIQATCQLELKIMTTANRVTPTRKSDNQAPPPAPDGRTTLLETSTAACRQNEGLSAKGKDSSQTEETSALQWLCKVLDGISALVGKDTIYSEIPGWMLPGPALPHPAFPRDSCGPQGRNAKDVPGCLTRNAKPNFEDGTWMTVHIPIPQTMQDRLFRPSSLPLSSDGNTHAQTETSTGTNNHRYNEGKCDDTRPPGNT